MLISSLWILLYVVIFILECYVLYLAVMNFKAQRHVLHWAVKVMAVIILAFGYVLDLILTMIIGTVIFLSLPKFSFKWRFSEVAWWKVWRWIKIKGEWTFTARLKRHRKAGGWRGKVATWICKEMLNPFTVGGHC